MNTLQEFVRQNAELIDNLNWNELELKIIDSNLMLPEITKLTEVLQETTELTGITCLWPGFLCNKKIERYTIPKTVQELSYNIFVNTEINYLELSPRIKLVDDETFYESKIRHLEMWYSNPLKILGSRLPKQYLEYVRYHGSLMNILEGIDISSFHCSIECDDGVINLDPGFYPEVTWHGDSSDAKESFSKVLMVMQDEGLVVKCADGKTAVWDEDGGFEIV